MYDFKAIDIGKSIKKRVEECDIDISRICKVFDCEESYVEEMYASKNLDTGVLLKWSKLLKFDFFRIYTQHLILFSPEVKTIKEPLESSLPNFRKNVYTNEIIFFILNLIKNGEKSKEEIIKIYNIPKTTLYNWIKKYQHYDENS